MTQFPWILGCFLLAMKVNVTKADDVSVYDYALERNEMIEEHIKQRGITHARIVHAMTQVQRHLFVPEDLRKYAYDDGPLPIGMGQTISQPFIVAYMTEAAQLKPSDHVLEIGTGSAYQAAILSTLVEKVYSVEIIRELAEVARERLRSLGYDNVEIKCGDGYLGWEEYAPFDAIIITAAPYQIPERLIQQLKVGGRMIIPVGTFFQELQRITRKEAGYEKEGLMPVRFVPMVHGDEK